MLRLKTMRTQAGISQAQFAKDMGVAQNTVSNWENENRTLDAETLSRVDRKSTRLNSSHASKSRMPSSA